MVFQLITGATPETLPTITPASYDKPHLNTILDESFCVYLSLRGLGRRFQRVYWILKTPMSCLVGSWRDGLEEE